MHRKRVTVMTPLASGVDLIEIERVQDALRRHGGRFAQHVFTAAELADVCGEDQDYARFAPSLAARFAAKEAVAKALGTGIGAVGWQEIEVLRGSNNAPGLHLHAAAKELAAELGLVTWSISLSHSHSHAIAMVVAVGNNP